MAKSCQELKKELEEETERIFLTCPDEIKRFHYGIITHSDAGKYSLDQYFGHWVHAYAHYYVYALSIPTYIIRLAADPKFDVEHLKKMFCEIFLESSAFFAEYGGQKGMAKYADEMGKVLDTVKTKEEFVELLGAFQIYLSRLYWWFHWYFPWGIGPAVCHRLSAEDIKEIERLSTTG